MFVLLWHQRGIKSVYCTWRKSTSYLDETAPIIFKNKITRVLDIVLWTSIASINSKLIQLKFQMNMLTAFRTVYILLHV